MNIQRIEYFIKVAEHLNFRRAAAELHISHQALSKQIRILEQEIGAALLERNANKLVLTEVGNKTVAIFRPILSEIYQGTADLQGFVKNKKNTLKIGYFNGFSYKRVVAPIIQRFNSEYPEIQIDILAADIGIIQELLMENSIDIAIAMCFDTDEWLGVEYFTLQEEPMKIIVSSNHPWYQLESVGIKEILQEKMLVFENRPLFGERSFLPQILTAGRVPVRNRDTYMGVLEQGHAFGVINDLQVKMEGEFRTFPLPEEYAEDMRLILAYKEQHPLSKKIRSLKM